MKAVTWFVILTVLVVHVSCELCIAVSDCVATLCGQGTQAVCHENVCTCAEDNYECYTKSDCHRPNAPHLTCPDSARHCFDNKCICIPFI